MLTPEQKTQLAILEWLGLYHPLARRLIIRIGNEGKRTVSGHVLATRMGLNKGASDLLLPMARGIYHGCFIEVKPDGWKCKGKKEHQHIDEQLNFLDLVTFQGYAGEMVIGVDAGIRFIKGYLEKDKSS